MKSEGSGNRTRPPEVIAHERFGERRRESLNGAPAKTQRPRPLPRGAAAGNGTCRTWSIRLQVSSSRPGIITRRRQAASHPVVAPGELQHRIEHVAAVMEQQSGKAGAADVFLPLVLVRAAKFGKNVVKLFRRSSHTRLVANRAGCVHRNFAAACPQAPL